MAKHGPLWRMGVIVLCGVWLGAGCVKTGTQVVSTVADARAAPGRRFLIVSQLAWTDKAWAGEFEKSVMTEFRKAGSPCKVQTRNPLALQADKVRYAAQIAEFNPDAVLVVEPGEGTVDQRGRSLTRRFEVGLFRNYTERARRELAWRATVTLEPAGSFIVPSDMAGLARDVVARLTADGILQEPKRISVRPSSAWPDGR